MRPLGPPKPSYLRNPRAMSKNPLLTRWGGGAGLGLLALSHAKSSLDSAKYGDMTTAALNAGVAGAAGYGSYMLATGQNRQLGAIMAKGTTTPILHAMRGMQSNYAKGSEGYKNVGKAMSTVAGAGKNIMRFFA